jgi:hypothetical protein
MTPGNVRIAPEVVHAPQCDRSSCTAAQPPGGAGLVLTEATALQYAITAEIARFKDAGLSFRSNLVAGPGGRKILLTDPAGNLIELFQPAQRPVAPPQPKS